MTTDTNKTLRKYNKMWKISPTYEMLKQGSKSLKVLNPRERKFDFYYKREKLINIRHIKLAIAANGITTKIKNLLLISLCTQ